jgi:hypothetical protein
MSKFKTIAIVVLLALLASAPAPALAVALQCPGDGEAGPGTPPADPAAPPADPAQAVAAAGELVTLARSTLRAALYSPGASGDAYHLVRELYLFHSHARTLRGVISRGTPHWALARSHLAKLATIAGNVDSILAHPAPAHDHSAVHQLWGKTRDGLARLTALLAPAGAGGPGDEPPPTDPPPAEPPPSDPPPGRR